MQEKKKLHDMCKTRWIERHEAYENFFALCECIVNTMGVILNEKQNEAEYDSWGWDRETLTKVTCPHKLRIHSGIGGYFKVSFGVKACQCETTEEEQQRHDSIQISKRHPTRASSVQKLWWRYIYRLVWRL